jgi:putative nucleotidyltransferase with HDIG domain
LELAAGIVSGAIAGVLVAALCPVVEATLGYTTDIKYLELANLANPLLKDLLLRAPGTYHHSVVAGTLAEAAAEAIGANASLARVAAYYHDVAKGRSPHYFAENLRGENPTRSSPPP